MNTVLDESHTPPAIDDSIRDHLRRCPPLKDFSREDFKEALQEFKIIDKAPGETVFAVDTHASSVFYLIAGNVSITGADGYVFDVKANSIEAMHALRPSYPAQVSAKAESAVTVARISRDVLDIIREANRTEQIELDELTTNEDLADQIFNEIYNDYFNGDLEAPSLPEVAIKIRTAIDDPDIGADAISQTLNADPALAAYCVRIANSAAFKGTAEIRTHRDAIVRLGLATTRDVVTAASLKNLFDTSDTALKNAMKEVWWHSCTISSYAASLAQYVNGLCPEHALLAGLVHDIGKVVILNKARELGESIDSETLGRAFRELSPQIGAMVVRHWQLGEPIVQCAIESEQFDRNPSNALELCDLVVLAHLMADEARPDGDGSLESVPAFQKLPEELRAVGITPLRDEAKKAIAEIANLVDG